MSRSTQILANAERGGLPRPGDIVAVLGKNFTSRMIAAAQGARVSHVATVISDTPPLIVEASHPRVRVRALSTLLNEAEHAYIIHHKSITFEQREEIVERACKFTPLPYGYPLLILHALNVGFATRWFTERRASGKERHSAAQSSAPGFSARKAGPHG